MTLWGPKIHSRGGGGRVRRGSCAASVVEAAQLEATDPDPAAAAKESGVACQPSAGANAIIPERFLFITPLVQAPMCTHRGGSLGLSHNIKWVLAHGRGGGSSSGAPHDSPTFYNASSKSIRTIA